MSEKIMLGVIKAWQSLPVQNKIISIFAVIGTILAVFWLSREGLKPGMEVLYSGLDAATAGEIMTEIESRGIAYDIRGQTIYVDASKKDSLRLEMASIGLPRQGEAGYELLDNLNSFATTSEMFNAAYWRAKEGELARTISAIPGIRNVRVHIGTAKTSAFSRRAARQSASVSLVAAGQLDAQQAKAIQYLTALAVAGLAPEDVAVIDTNYGVVVGPGSDGELPGSTSLIETKAQSIENDIVQLLEAYVGQNNVRATVSLDMDLTRQAVSERIYDPAGQVLRSKSTSESSHSSDGHDSNVTVASNLPEGDAQGAARNSSRRNDTTEDVTYEVSQILRESETLPGAITRMSIAVLINASDQVGSDGTPLSTPRSPEDIASLQRLVEMAAGIDRNRGDDIVLQSVPFAPVLQIDGSPRPDLMRLFVENYLFRTLQVLFIGIVALVLGLFVVKPLLTQKSLPSPVAQIAAPPDQAPATDALAQVVTESPMMSPTTAKDGGTVAPSDPLEALKTIATENADATADLLTAWLEEPEKQVS